MADVDDLLAELDDVLENKTPAPSTSSSRYTKENNFPQPPPPRSKPSDSGPSDDIDALLADLGGLEPSPPARKQQQQQVASISSSSKLGGGAPMPAFPGSSSSGSSESRNATGLRCTKCDFRVLRFLDGAWSPDADYMFFRNFMPNIAKLETKLVPTDGGCAYACQCSWASAELGAPHGVANWFMAR